MIRRFPETNVAVRFAEASSMQELDVRALVRAGVKDSASFTSTRQNAASTVRQRTALATAIRFVGKVTLQ